MKQIRIGLDVATNTGISILEFRDGVYYKTWLNKTIQIYFRNDYHKTCAAIYDIISELFILIKTENADQVNFYIELTKYSKNTAQLFGKLVGMFEMNIHLMLPNANVKEIDANTWHTQLFGKLPKDSDYKQFSLMLCNKTYQNHGVDMKITDDNVADAFNLAYNGDKLSTLWEKHEQIMERIHTKRNKEHKLNILNDRLNYWRDKRDKLLSNPNPSKKLLRDITKAHQKITEYQAQIEQLKQK